jgi:hypothetical protein
MRSPLVLAAALALAPAAFAQNTTSSAPTIGQQADRTFDRAEDATQRAVNPPPGQPTIGQRADRTFDRAEDATSRTVNPPPGEPSLGQKADKLFDRMEDGTGRMVDRARNATAPRDDARMGNAPAQGSR